MDEILLESYRGGILETVHRGHICIVGEDGEIKYSVGDTDFVTFLRSSAKPIQAIPVVEYGIDKEFGLKDNEVAVMTGSHRAEEWHVEAVEGIMKKINVTDENFVCLPTYPLGDAARTYAIKNELPPRSIYHNCSGKHLGIMSLCRHLNCSLEDYWDINNPAQQEILKHIAYMSDYKAEDVKIGVDGCGVPVFAMPLKNLATAFMKLSCPDVIEDKNISAAVKRITGLMNEYPLLVAGTNRICTELLKDPNIVAKGGSAGTYCFGLRKERLGIAIKIMDGSETPWTYTIASILEQLGYENKETIERLYKLAPKELMNDNKKIVGEYVSTFKLK